MSVTPLGVDPDAEIPADQLGWFAFWPLALELQRELEALAAEGQER